MGTLVQLEIGSLPERLSWDRPLTDDEFEVFATANDLLQLERNREGEIIVSRPTGDDTGSANAEINWQLRNWWNAHERGRVYDSSTGFFLPDGSNLSPDAAYVLPENLGPREGRGRKMAHRCPDFVIELLSASDRLRKTQAKMEGWIVNGAALGWLIDPYQRQVTAYAPNQAPRTVTAELIEGTGPVEGFALNLAKVWRFYET